jgi:hypothetical protein
VALRFAGPLHEDCLDGVWPHSHNGASRRSRAQFGGHVAAIASIPS